MWAIAFWLKQAATLQHNHANGEKEERNAPPVEIEFFHGCDFVFLLVRM